MKKTLPLSDLTEQEARIRKLLVDASDHVGTLPDHAKPTLRFAGGWVRDKLLGKSSDDIDVAIDNLSGYEFGLLLKHFVTLPGATANEGFNKGGKSVVGALTKIEANPEKSKHLETATVKIFGLQIDLVNLRKETYVADSRNPTKLEFGTALEDALRRDATVNALFYNIHTLEIEDFTGRGLEDMERKIIKTPLPPLQTFKDDPLRVLRHIRFASRLGFIIDAGDLQAMSCSEIKLEFMRRILVEKDDGPVGKAVKTNRKKAQTKAEETLKISRERVGVEIEKMLRGVNPCMALRLIDELGLYNNIFTNPEARSADIADTRHWHRAYNFLLSLVQSQTQSQTLSKDPEMNLESLRRILLRGSEDLYRAWLLCAFVPWARSPMPSSEKRSNKKPRSLAGFSAREGIKVENNVLGMVEDAVQYLQEIIEMRRLGAPDAESRTTGAQKEFNLVDRQIHGKAIRRWGSYWRSCVLYAMLVQISESEGTEQPTIADGYRAWLLALESHSLLEVYSLKPLVNGHELCKALGEEPGPWMKPAMETIVEWQLGKPDESDPKGAIEHVRRRKEEFGLG
ncbi:MAG: hypothetical protein Q9191_000860 [Dirinaria sp. TL-2023a]